jgi:hypothetical protein
VRDVGVLLKRGRDDGLDPVLEWGMVHASNHGPNTRGRRHRHLAGGRRRNDTAACDQPPFDP